MRFQDRVVFITGAGSGIGRATARRVASEGALVAVVDRDEEHAAEVAQEIGTGRALALGVDVGDEVQVRDAVSRTCSEFGGIHHVVTSAGIFVMDDLAELADVTLDTFVNVLQVNLVGTFLAIRESLPALVAAGDGSIVTIASTAAIRGHGRGAGYTASKGGVTALTRLLAVEYGPRGVRANCICPGAVDTPMTGGFWSSAEAQAGIKASHPLGKVAQPEEIAATAAFLLSTDASHMTGTVTTVDGGVTIA